MTTFKQIKYLGYLDLFTSVGQMLVISVMSMLSLYFSFKNEMRKGVSSFSPVINMCIALIGIYGSVQQIIAVRKLIKVANQNTSDEELYTVQINWAYWNLSTSFVTFLWQILFGIPMILGCVYPMDYAGVFALWILITRLILNLGFYKMLDTDNERGQETPIPGIEFEMHEMRTEF